MTSRSSQPDLFSRFLLDCAGDCAGVDFVVKEPSDAILHREGDGYRVEVDGQIVGYVMRYTLRHEVTGEDLARGWEAYTADDDEVPVGTSDYNALRAAQVLPGVLGKARFWRAA